MKCELTLLSSLEKVFFEKPENILEHKSGSMLKNEIYSFQLLCMGSVKSYPHKVKCKIVVESEIQSYIHVKQVGYVPSFFPARLKRDEDYITTTPGLFPDPLYPVVDGEFDLVSGQARSLWISVEPNGEIFGTYPIVFKVLNKKDEVIAETSFNIDIVDACLPEMDMRNTSWFHGDCIAKLHNVELQSDAYYTLVEKYIKTYVKFGHNMILTPVFTPPLDTLVGGERPTNQLVDVMVNQGVYSFNFDKLRKWIDLCQKCGIKYFEISHLFTQWGAYHAPKIMVTVDGEYKQIFGWETDATSEEYKEFLHAFMDALIPFLEKKGIMKNCYFHVSDEPREEHLEQYRATKAILLSHVDEAKVIDALSSYDFYEKGIVSKPIVTTDHMEPFLEHGVEGLWTYYCADQDKEVANRLLAMPSHRNRILGYQLYKYNIEGFLQWGYNFWFTEHSTEVIDPYVETAAGEAFQSGDSYVVYPMDKRGEVICSLRLYVFYEAIQDMRALKLLETLYDRQTVLDMLQDVEGFKKYPRNSQYILQLREKVNEMIKGKYIK